MSRFEDFNSRRMVLIICASALVIVGAASFLLQLLPSNRFIATDSMSPSFKLDEQVLVDRKASFLPKRFQRGDPVVFYIPNLYLGKKYEEPPLPSTLEQFLKNPIGLEHPTFIRRIIGLPGETISVQAGQGVFVDGKLLRESSYASKPPSYNLDYLDQIQGHSLANEFIKPYNAPECRRKPIVVPPQKFFVMADDRSESPDSHTFGFVDASQIIGRVAFKYYPKYELVLTPLYSSTPAEKHNSK